MSTMSQGIMMGGPASEHWWSLFLDMHGRDSEEEKAFLGFLSTKGIPAMASPDVLAQAYTEFKAYVDESHTQTTAVETDEAVRLREIREREPRPVVPRSSLSLPELQKPMTAATRPPEMRDEEAAAQPSPLQDPSAVAQATSPGDSAAHLQATGATPSGATPQESGEAPIRPTEEESRQQRQPPATAAHTEEEARHQQATEAEARRHAEEQDTQRGRRR